MLLAIAAFTVAAQDWVRQRLDKLPRDQEWITIKHDGRSVETFVVDPESKDKAPVVLVIHEIFGVSDWAQEVAEAGFIAVAPDLLLGMGPQGGRTPDFSAGGAREAVSARIDATIPPTKDQMKQAGKSYDPSDL